MQADFRHYLKTQTDAQHMRIDNAFSDIDISARDGLALFLAVHGACFSAMLDAAEDRSNRQAFLTEMILCIKRDLNVLGASTGDIDIPNLGQLDQLALDYMIEGSRLGSQVLKRRWATSTDQQVIAAKSYFSLEPISGHWRDVCKQLSNVPINSQRAARIVTDTQALFDVFYAVFRAQRAVTIPRLEPQQ